MSHSSSWSGLRNSQKTRWVELMVERAIRAVSFSAIATVFLIFIFVGREAFPIFFGNTSSALVQTVIPAADFEKTPPETVRKYLGMSVAEFRSKDKETIQTLLEIREEAQNEISAEMRKDPDAGVDTTEWRYLLAPHQWSGYDKPEYIWQPVGTIHKYNLIPLIIGSIKTTVIGMLFAFPLALGAAIFVSQMASPSVREWIKPSIELLSGIPSVVVGTFALLTLATVMQNLFGYQTRLNALVAGVALGLAVIPLVFSLAEDALTSVPSSFVQASLALGASRWQTAWKIVLPAAAPGVFASLVLGFGRAIGETMIVLMVCSASVVSWSPLDSARSVTTTIAAEMAEAVSGGHHYRVLFLLGTLLFTFTFLTNLLGQWIMSRVKSRLEGR